jgi:uncharacterized membrane protein YoaK (UPF0700 family)
VTTSTRQWTGGSVLRRALVDEKDGPLPAMLVAFTMLAGVVDATSILALDHVFVAAVTGNIVFIGLGLTGAAGFSVLASGVALAGFVVGVFPAARLCRLSTGHRGRAVRNVALMKTTLAVPVTVLVVVAGDDLHPAVRLTVTALLAMSMGGQLAAIRYLKVPDLVTVVLTLTVTSALTERGLGWSHPAVIRRLVAVLAFAVGAICGALLIRYVALGAALALGLAIIVGVAITAHSVARSKASWVEPR